jgi:hypothetical protein
MELRKNSAVGRELMCNGLLMTRGVGQSTAKVLRMKILYTDYFDTEFATSMNSFLSQIQVVNAEEGVRVGLRQMATARCDIIVLTMRAPRSVLHFLLILLILFFTLLPGG